MATIAESVELEFTVWMQFENQMYNVGTVTGSRAELGDFATFHEAVQDALVQVSQELDENAVIRLHVPASIS